MQPVAASTVSLQVCNFRRGSKVQGGRSVTSGGRIDTSPHFVIVSNYEVFTILRFCLSVDVGACVSVDALY